ncbi:hypothetical protein [Gillisia xinjiangensis]
MSVIYKFIARAGFGDLFGNDVVLIFGIAGDALGLILKMFNS